MYQYQTLDNLSLRVDPEVLTEGDWTNVQSLIDLFSRDIDLKEFLFGELEIWNQNNPWESKDIEQAIQDLAINEYLLTIDHIPEPEDY